MKARRIGISLVAVVCLAVLAGLLILHHNSPPALPTTWATLTNSCVGGTGDDSPAAVARGVIAAQPFTITYPKDWTVSPFDQTFCMAEIEAPAPDTRLTINGYGFLGPYSYKEKPDDKVYTVNGLSVHQQALKNESSGKSALVSMILDGNHVRGIITLEYMAGASADAYYGAINTKVIDSFRPGGQK